jgi:hypothetical protein
LIFRSLRAGNDHFLDGGDPLVAALTVHLDDAGVMAVSTKLQGDFLPGPSGH